MQQRAASPCVRQNPLVKIHLKNEVQTNECKGTAPPPPKKKKLLSLVFLQQREQTKTEGDSFVSWVTCFLNEQSLNLDG